MNETIVIPGRPFAKQRARSTKNGRHYTPAKTRGYEDHVAVCAQEVWPGPPLDVVVRVDVQAWFPRPKRMMWKKKPMLVAWCPSKPDRDNVDKIILDGLVNAGVLLDDNIVVTGGVSKRYVDGYGQEVPRVVITLSDPGRADV